MFLKVAEKRNTFKRKIYGFLMVSEKYKKIHELAKELSKEEANEKYGINNKDSDTYKNFFFLRKDEHIKRMMEIEKQ